MENQVANAVSNPYNLTSLWVTGDFVLRATLVILMIMSLASWYIILTKIWDQRRLKTSAKLAEKNFWTASSVKDGAEKLRKGDDYRKIAEDGMRAVSHHDGRLTDRIDLHEWITMSLQRSVNVINGKLQNGLSILATVGSTAPFVGLFGTVWGVMQALIAIGLSGQPSIDKVAGPVGEALFSTAFGLFAAVPAVIGYNWLLSRNKSIMDTLRGFTSDLHAYLISGARVAVSDNALGSGSAARPAAAQTAAAVKR